MSKWYNRRGEPITMEQWAASFETDDRIVAKTEAGGYTVSTVWLGLDHSWGGGTPQIFETMLFGDGPRNEDLWRYGTEKAALAHHDELVADLGGESE